MKALQGKWRSKTMKLTDFRTAVRNGEISEEVEVLIFLKTLT